MTKPPLDLRTLWRELTPGSRLWVLGLLAGVAGLTVYWMHKYQGPYRFVVEWQLRHLGAFGEVVSATVAILSAVFIMTCLLVVLIRLRWVRFRQTPFIPEPSVQPADITPAVSRSLRSSNDWLYKHYWRVLGAMVSVGLLASGIWHFVYSVQSGSLQMINVDELRTEIPPPSRWVCLDGRAIRRAAITFENDHRTAGGQYIPLVGKRSTSKDPVKAFLKRDSADPMKDADTRNDCFEGIVEHGGLPEFYRVRFSERGVPIDSNAWVLDWGNGPRSLKGLAIFEWVLGGLIGVWILVWIRRHRALSGGG
jgi:hypothetical protein